MCYLSKFICLLEKPIIIIIRRSFFIRILDSIPILWFVLFQIIYIYMHPNKYTCSNIYITTTFFPIHITLLLLLLLLLLNGSHQLHRFVYIDTCKLSRTHASIYIQCIIPSKSHAACTSSISFAFFTRFAC